MIPVPVSRLWISADLSVWWPITKHKPSATSQSVTSDLARTRDNIYIMNNILDVAFITRSIVVLCKAKNDDPHACGSTLHWSTWDSRHSRGGVWSASAVWWARCVTVICETNRQKLEQIIRYLAGASYNTFTRKQMTNLQLTTDGARAKVHTISSIGESRKQIL